MNEEIKAISLILIPLAIVVLFGICGVVYSIQKETECKKYAIEHKYDYKEIELICK